ncbi:A24 family peptidase [Clostridium sp. JN-9]|uniref:prepilin peptidase n=1 Tax=Clostridium sp. JN-9 TaxID=2507159 RepID=UPI000FFDFDF7|nr:A24 family peptidase [Clostridium sp. JN-9]QAT41174.1 prepilin peptidase [Clostridium sp. JN-9]
MLIIKIYIFIIGLIIGSFLNVCIYRIPREESISFPPSHCTNCGNRIKWYDLIPVFSYLILRGKCRYCKERISFRYPLIELTTGIMFLALYMKFGLSIDFVKSAILICFLLVIGIIDFDTTDVYSKTTYSGIVFGIILLIINFIYFSGGVLDFLIGGAIGFSVIALIILLTHGMGWGDAEICGMCGLFLGWKLTIFMLFISFTLGGLIGIILLITKKKSRKDYIPFGPYISIAAAISIFIGNSAIAWYLGIL